MNERQESLMILTPGFPANEADTTCLPAQQALVTAILDAYPQITVTVISFQYPFGRQPYTWKGIKVLPVGGKNNRGILRLLTWWRVWKQLRTQHRRHKLSYVLSFWLGECALTGHRFASSRHIPHATWVLGQDARPGNRYLRLFSPPAGSLMAISDFVAEQLKDNYKLTAAKVVPSGMHPLAHPMAGQARHIDILGAGSLIPLKRFDLFIDVIAALSGTFPAMTVMICGDGPERNNLIRQTEARGVGHIIQFTGALPHRQLLETMQRSRILLHTSSYEGFSGVCLEALAAGAHVVSICHPQRSWIRHWHIATDSEEMVRHCSNLLQNTFIDHSPVVPYTVSAAAKQVMSVLGAH